MLAGTFSIGKGQKEVIEAMKYLDKYNVNLFFAGFINDYARELKSKIEKDNIKNIHFCGLVKDLNKLRQKMDIAIVCSIKEAFGRIVIEDMLAKIAIVANNAGSMPELMNTGLLFENNNPKQIAEKVIYLIENTVEYNRIVNNAFNFSQQFTDRKTAKAICNIIETEIDE